MSNNLGEKISVCLLTFNHADVIESTLRSILDQTVTGYEIIVSDDCSTDGTWERVLELAATDPRIKAMRTPHNMGMAGNANFAVAQSRRPYIALLHHDDLYRTDLLEKWGGVFDRHPDTTFVFNPYGVFESDYVYDHRIPSECIAGDWLLKEHLFPCWGSVVRGTAMIRREAWDRTGGMREQFGMLADVDLWMRLAMRGPVGYVAEPVVTMRHQRPSYYPEIYKSVRWSWPRQRLLYEIHGANRLTYLKLQTPLGRLRWWGFRLKLSLETSKWLTYAVVKRRPEIIASSRESETSFDLWPLRVLRGMLRRTVSAGEGPPH